MRKKIDLKSVVWKEGKQYVAWNLNTAISSFGKTRKEALVMLQEALELHFEDTPVSKIHKVQQPSLASISIKKYA